MSIDGRLQRLEAVAPVDLDAAIEAELAKLTPDAQAQFLAEFAREHGLDEPVELKKRR